MKGVKIIVPRPIMSRRGFLKLAGVGAAIGYAEVKLLEKPVYNLVDGVFETLGLNPDTGGIILSSNLDFMYTKLNLSRLEELGFKRTYVQRVEKDGDIFYRTIVGTTDRNENKTLEKLLADEHFNPEQRRHTAQSSPFMFLNEKQITPFYYESEEQKEKRMVEIEVEFKINVEKIKDKAEYVKLAVPFIQERYRLHHGNKRRLTKDKAGEIAVNIYQAAREFNIPIVEYTSLISHESKFNNIFGDLKFYDKKHPSKSNHSEGYVQMRIETQKWVLKKMRAEGIKDIPTQPPYRTVLANGRRDSLLNHPTLQFRMGAWFFRYCLKKSGWDGKSRVIPSKIIEEAISKYNTGPNTDEINERYLKEVKKEKRQYEVLGATAA